MQTAKDKLVSETTTLFQVPQKNMADHLANVINVAGYVIPKGMRLAHNPSGLPYITKENEEEDKEEIENEHARAKITILASHAKLEESYGLSVRLCMLYNDTLFYF